MEEGKKLAKEGMQQSLLNADIDWRMHAEDIINDIIKNHRTFTSDDILIRLKEEGARSVNNSALGPIIKRFADRELIESEGFVKSKRPERHCAPVQVWASKVYERKYL